jgi:hypothetical protein
MFRGQRPVSATVIPRTLAVATIAMACAVQLTAQVAITAGERLRIHQTDGEILVGTVTYLAPEALGLKTDRSRFSVPIPFDQVAQLEKSVGRYRRFVRNLLITVGVSSCTVGTLSALAWSPCTCTEFLCCMFTPNSRSEALLWGGIAGAVVGVPLGTLVGLRKYDRWESLPLTAIGSTRFSIRPAGGGIEISALVSQGTP